MTVHFGPLRPPTSDLARLFWILGNDVNGELAVSVFNASNLREIDTPQSTTFKKKRFQECFIARGILYCIGMFDQYQSATQLLVTYVCHQHRYSNTKTKLTKIHKSTTISGKWESNYC